MTSQKPATREGFNYSIEPFEPPFSPGPPLELRGKENHRYRISPFNQNSIIVSPIRVCQAASLSERFRGTVRGSVPRYSVSLCLETRIGRVVKGDLTVGRVTHASANDANGIGRVVAPRRRCWKFHGGSTPRGGGRGRRGSTRVAAHVHLYLWSHPELRCVRFR